MSSEPVIEVAGLGKCYRIYERPADRLKQLLWGGLRAQAYGREFWAVRDVTLTVRRGEAVGLIGANGSGKSTTLQMIAGIMGPTSGTVTTQGRITALLELGSGFNPEYSGRDNIAMYGTILGLGSREIAERMDRIVAFADIGDFIERPLKTYSSGMAVRLAFSCAVHVDPDILIVDEALSVGDTRFQQKCLRMIEDLRQRTAVLMVTHDLSALKRFCQSAIWLDQGRVRMQGTAAAVAAAYLDECHGISTAASAPVPPAAAPPRLAPIPTTCEEKGTREAVITHAGFVDGGGAMLHEPIPGSQVDYLIAVEARTAIEQPLVVGLTLTNRLGQELFAINSLWADGAPALPSPRAGERRSYRLRFSFPPLNHGIYCVSPAIAIGSQSAHTILHWVHDATVVTVPRSPRRVLPGMLSLTGYHAEEVP